MTVPTPVQDVLDGAPALFLSPHLDDAVLSCGTLLLRAPRATVVTVFTEAAPGPHTRAARSFLRQCAASGAEELFAERRREDVEVVEAAGGATAVHLGRRDALFRTRCAPAALGRVLPELVHRYPTFRFDIARGRVAGAERDLARRIAEQVDALAAGPAPRWCSARWASGDTWTTCWCGRSGRSWVVGSSTTRTSRTRSTRRPTRRSWPRTGCSVGCRRTTRSRSAS